MGKSEVYSWRLSREMKQEPEAAARTAKLSVGALIESIVAAWIRAENPYNGDEDGQKRLHAAASRSIGMLRGGNPRRAEQARDTIRSRLAKADARSRAD